MKLILVILLLCLSINASAIEIEAPPVPESGSELMPQRAERFSEGLWELLRAASANLHPEFHQAMGCCLQIIAVVLLMRILQNLSESVKKTAGLTGAIGICIILLENTSLLIRLGLDTVTELSEYGKLLLPVMTSAMAAQGGVTTSATLYAGSTVFISTLCILVEKLLIPLTYVLLFLSTGGCALGENTLKKMSSFVKWLSTWILKIILYLFTGYMGLTGVISGAADATALKAAKLTISGVVPVVGGILADASEAVLISAGLAKNAAGIYGILAILAVFMGPFLRIALRYLLLKFTAAVSEIAGPQNCAALIADYASAMGFVLAMTGSVCLMLLISTVCFIKGVG